MSATLLILAAGLGSRYGGLKQIDQVGPSGETIMDYNIYDAIHAGFTKVVFVIRKDIEKEMKEFITRYKNKFPIDMAFQELDSLPVGFTPPAERKKPWGTGHAIWVARNVVKEAFAVINADDYYGTDAFKSLYKFLSEKKDTEVSYCMVGYLLKNTLSEFGQVSRGVCTIKNKLLEDVIERSKIQKIDSSFTYTDEEGKNHPLTGEEIVSMNCWGFSPSLFSYLDTFFLDFIKNNGNEIKSEFYIPTVINKLIKSNTASIEVLNCNASWFGVTYKEDKPTVISRINELIEKGIYPKKLW